MQIIKRLIYCALVALIAISCNENDEQWDKPTAPLVIPKTFYAQAPIPDSKTRAAWDCTPESWGPATRTYAVVDPANAAEYFQYWSAGDAISLFFTDYNLKYTLQSYKNGELDYGIFELTGEANQGAEFAKDYYYSVYPYKEDTYIFDYGDGDITEVEYTFPEVQHYNGDSYANGENGMIAIEPASTTDSVLYFKNFCSYLQLRLLANEGTRKSIKRITLTANNITDKLAGKGYVEIENEYTDPVVFMNYSATNYITLDCGSGAELSQDKDNPSRFWFVLPGDFTFTEGFNVTIIFNDNTYFKQSTSKEIYIARSHIKPMAPFEPIGVEPNGPIRYKYNDPSITEPYTLNATFYGVDGEKLDIVDQIFDEKTGEWVVLLSGTLKTIGSNSFKEDGHDIEYIKVDNENTPVIINNFAFYNCTADRLIINNDVESINESAFTGSTIRDLNINGSVTTISNSAGTGSDIERLIISGNVETIDEEAFSGCEALHTIDIEGSVTEIGKQAFLGCKALQTLNVGSVETISYRAFYMCSNLTEVSIPGVKYIEAGAFRSCTSLETITLESVVEIDDNAFMDCSSLTSAVISEHCTMIGEGAFCNAINLQTVYCYAVKPPFIKTDNDDKSYVFDNTHSSLIIYVPQGSKSSYTNRNYFVNHTYNDPNIKAKVNWWQQEYRSKIKEMTTE